MGWVASLLKAVLGNLTTYNRVWGRKKKIKSHHIGLNSLAMSWPPLKDVLSCLVGSHKADCFDIRMIANKVNSFKKKNKWSPQRNKWLWPSQHGKFPLSHCYEEVFIFLCFYPRRSSLFPCSFNSLNYKFYLASFVIFPIWYSTICTSNSKGYNSYFPPK